MSEPTPSLTHSKETTPERLLQAAISVFAEKGFAGARVDEIARRGRANKAMIYYHFGNKREIYQAALLHALAQTRKAIQELVQREPRARERLLAMAEELSHRFTEEPALPQMMLREILAGGRHLTPVLTGHMAAAFAAVRGTLEQGRNEGVFRAVDPFLTHLTLVGSLLFFHASANFRQRVMASELPQLPLPTPEVFLAHLKELLIRGLGPEPQGSRASRANSWKKAN